LNTITCPPLFITFREQAQLDRLLSSTPNKSERRDSMRSGALSLSNQIATNTEETKEIAPAFGVMREACSFLGLPNLISEHLVEQISKEDTGGHSVFLSVREPGRK
jgi:hypothetical protein